MGVLCNDAGYINVDEYMQSNIDGVYATGDVTGVVKQIVVSAGQGAIASSRIQTLLL